MFCEHCGSGGPADCAVCLAHDDAKPGTGPDVAPVPQTTPQAGKDTQKAPDATGAILA